MKIRIKIHFKMYRVLFLSFLFFIFLCFSLTSYSFAGTVTYQYDNLNRLIRAKYSNGTVIAYTYDSAGNRLSKRVGKAAIPWLHLLLLVGSDLLDRFTFITGEQSQDNGSESVAGQQIAYLYRN